MTSLPRRAQAMIHEGHSHPDFLRSRHRQQGFGRTGGDARRIVAEIAGDLIGKNHGRAIDVKHDRIMRAGLYTITALGATLEKQRFSNGAGRP